MMPPKPALLVAGATAAVLIVGGAFSVMAIGPALGGNGGNAIVDCSTTVTPTGKAPSNASLFAAIKFVTVGNNRLTLAMLEGSHLESSWSNTAEGAGSFGPYQIQDPGVVHPDITVAQAEDPAYSTNYMVGAYRNALRVVDPRLWATDPERAAEQTAMGAEIPAGDYYVVRTPARVDAAFAESIAVMQQVMHVSTDFTQAPAGGGVDLALAPRTPPSSCTPVPPASATGQRKMVLDAAYSQLGVPYSFAGGNAGGPTLGVCTNDAGFNDCNVVGIDCSGLTLYAYAKIGINFPHFAATQWGMTNGFIVTEQAAQPGDLVFFTGADGSMSAPGHVGIYIGDNQMISAPQSGDVVKVSTVSTWGGLVGLTDPFAWLASTQR
jgi:cell wall-associated NlpC family hydrolase